MRALVESDAPALVALRAESLRQEPMSFGSSPEDDRFGNLEALTEILRGQAEHVVFGAFDGSDLIGMVGLARPPKLKVRHHANIWGMYVNPAHRGSGHGAALLTACVEQARTWGVLQVNLGVSSAAPAARRLYERGGFQVWGTERRALVHEGQAADELHLSLHLDRDSDV